MLCSIDVRLPATDLHDLVEDTAIVANQPGPQLGEKNENNHNRAPTYKNYRR